MSTASVAAGDLDALAKQAREKLDQQTYEIVQWHFHESTGALFWLEKKKELKFDPLKDVKNFDDLKKFPLFEDDWLREGPVRKWVPKAYEDRPTFVFETGGTTGQPKRRVVVDDFRIDYEMFSHTLPDKYFPKGANWLMLGPSGPRRLRLAVEHLCQYRGGICFCVDLDPRWVIKLIKKGWMEHLEEYKKHVIDQAITVLQSNNDIKCMFTTPKLLESLASRLEEDGTSIPEVGITGIFSGGTEFTPQWTRFCIEEYFGGQPEQSGVYMTPTYGNTLMGLACSKPVTPEEGYKISYYAPQPRAATEVVNMDDHTQLVGYGETGRVKLYTLTKEFFVPGFLERDEGEREKPYAKYPWDGVSGVRPYSRLAGGTTVGVSSVIRPRLPLLPCPAVLPTGQAPLRKPAAPPGRRFAKTGCAMEHQMKTVTSRRFLHGIFLASLVPCLAYQASWAEDGVAAKRPTGAPPIVVLAQAKKAKNGNVEQLTLTVPFLKSRHISTTQLTKDPSAPGAVETVDVHVYEPQTREITVGSFQLRLADQEPPTPFVTTAVRKLDGSLADRQTVLSRLAEPTQVLLLRGQELDRYYLAVIKDVLLVVPGAGLSASLGAHEKEVSAEVALVHALLGTWTDGEGPRATEIELGSKYQFSFTKWSLTRGIPVERTARGHWQVLPDARIDLQETQFDEGNGELSKYTGVLRDGILTLDGGKEFRRERTDGKNQAKQVIANETTHHRLKSMANTSRLKPAR